MARQKIRVLLADDSTRFRGALAGFLREFDDIEIVGEASDGRLTIELTRRLVPDVVTMDVDMPGLNGIEATRIIHSEFPQVRIIALSVSDASMFGDTMQKAGAVGFISKSTTSDTLIEAIRNAANAATSIRPASRRQKRHAGQTSELTGAAPKK